MAIDESSASSDESIREQTTATSETARHRNEACNEDLSKSNPNETNETTPCSSESCRTQRVASTENQGGSYGDRIPNQREIDSGIKDSSSKSSSTNENTNVTDIENKQTAPDVVMKEDKQSTSHRVRFSDEVINRQEWHQFQHNSMRGYQSDVRRRQTTAGYQPQTSYKPTIIAKAQNGVAQQMKNRGIHMVEDTNIWETPVKIEFNFDRNTAEYNVRKNVVELLSRMKTVDQKLIVKSTIQDNVEWVTVNTLPEDGEFNDHFQLKEFTYRKFCKVVVHVKLITELPINRIKYTPVVRNYIFENNIWLKTDRFNARIESSPGHIMMLHPKLINRKGYAEELALALQKANDTMAPSTTDKDMETDAEEDAKEQPPQTKVVPYFYLETSIKKWGELKAEVLRINCAKEDSERLKALLSVASEHGLLERGLYVPIGLHLMEGKSLVTNILRKHLQYIGKVTGVPLTGLSQDDMQQKGKNDKTAKDLILGIKGVHSVEKVRDRQSPGQWSIIIDKERETRILEDLQTNLAELYKAQTGQKSLIMAGTKKIQGTGVTQQGVATYTEILAQTYSENKSETKTKKGHPHNITGTIKVSVSKRDGRQSEHRPVDTHDGANNPENGDMSFSPEGQLDLTNKIATLEANYASIIETQQQILQTQKQETKRNKDKEGDQQKTKQELLDTIDRKIHQSNTEQQNTIQETRSILQKEVQQTIDKKMDNMSITVANYVTTQLIEVFKQYMGTTNTLEGRTYTQGGVKPLITQESNMPILGGTQQGTADQTYQREDNAKAYSSNAAMRQQLDEIGIQTDFKSSLHDKTIEQHKDNESE